MFEFLENVTKKGNIVITFSEKENAISFVKNHKSFVIDFVNVKKITKNGACVGLTEYLEHCYYQTILLVKSNNKFVVSIRDDSLSLEKISGMYFPLDTTVDFSVYIDTGELGKLPRKITGVQRHLEIATTKDGDRFLVGRGADPQLIKQVSSFLLALKANRNYWFQKKK